MFTTSTTQLTPRKLNKEKLIVDDSMDLCFRFQGADFADEGGGEEKLTPSGLLEINGARVGFRTLTITYKSGWARPEVLINKQGD